MSAAIEGPGRDRLVATIEELHQELEAGSDWENDTLGPYLESFSALLRSVENSYLNVGQPVPTDPWEILIDVFRGARYYE